MNVIEHNPIWSDDDCQADLRISVAVALAEHHAGLRLRLIEKARDQIATATLIQFPKDRTRARGEL